MPSSALKLRNLAEVLGPTQYAVWRKGSTGISHTQASIRTKSNATVALFDCSAAFNHADRHDDLVTSAVLFPHLGLRFFFHPLARHAQFKTEAHRWCRPTTASPKAAQRLQPRPPPSSCWWRISSGQSSVARAGEEAKEAIDLFAFLDDLTLVPEERFLEEAIRAMEAAPCEGSIGRE